MVNYSNIVLSKTTIKPLTILEIGSRDGDDANILRNFFKINEENVFVVEPNPVQIDLIYSKYPKFNIIKKAIYNQSGFLKFNACRGNSAGVSSLLDRIDDFYEKTSDIIEVETITGEKLLNEIEKEIDLCKIDVEGATFQVLESFGKDLSKIKSFHIECEHIQVWKNQKLYPHIKEFLNNNNFKELYFHYVNNIPQQSDSIWVNRNFIK